MISTPWFCILRNSPFICIQTVPAGSVTSRHRWSHALLKTASSAARRGVTPRKKAAVSSCVHERGNGIRGTYMLHNSYSVDSSAVDFFCRLAFLAQQAFPSEKRITREGKTLVRNKLCSYTSLQTQNGAHQPLVAIRAATATSGLPSAL